MSPLKRLSLSLTRLPSRSPHKLPPLLRLPRHRLSLSQSLHLNLLGSRLLRQPLSRSLRSLRLLLSPNLLLSSSPTARSPKRRSPLPSRRRLRTRLWPLLLLSQLPPRLRLPPLPHPLPNPPRPHQLLNPL